MLIVRCSLVRLTKISASSRSISRIVTRLKPRDDERRGAEGIRSTGSMPSESA